MKEEFLHYLWKYKLYNTSNLTTVNGETIEIINSGLHNLDAGPDFFNGKVKVGKTTWAGNIEIHVKSSDWLKHNHQTDKAYDNVVLHVVYQYDKPVLDKNNQPIPTLELKNIIDQSLYGKYTDLIESKDWIPCGNQIKLVDDFTINTWLNRLAIERLERKSEEIKHTLSFNKNDWEQTFYQYLFKYFGLKVNALPFEQLAKNTPLKITEKHNQLGSIEALFYGQAGFLEEELKDEYYQNLQKEYQFLKAKFKLQAIDKSLWKLLRLRPANFPTIRISQLSNVLAKNPRLFSKVIQAKTLAEIQDYFRVNASKYWDSHYQYGGDTTPPSTKKLGINTINNIIINVVVPFTFVYGKFKQDEILVEKALMLLENTPPEKNTIITNWKNLGVTIKQSMQTQSLIELKNNYCSAKKCLNCSIGNHLLKL